MIGTASIHLASSHLAEHRDQQLCDLQPWRHNEDGAVCISMRMRSALPIPACAVTAYTWKGAACEAKRHRVWSWLLGRACCANADCHGSPALWDRPLLNVLEQVNWVAMLADPLARC